VLNFEKTGMGEGGELAVTKKARYRATGNRGLRFFHTIMEGSKGAKREEEHQPRKRHWTATTAVNIKKYDRARAEQ